MDRNIWLAIGAGVLTGVIVPYVAVLVEVLSGISPMGFAIVMFVPVGAIVCGFLSISGFYLAATRLGLERPMPQLFAAMVLVQFLSFVLVYWFAYRGAFVPAYDYAPHIGFGEFVEASIFGLTATSRQFGEGEFGSAGILVVFLRFLGFMLAGITAYKQLPGSGSFLDD